VTVVLPQFPPSGVRDPYAESEERERRRDADEVRIPDHERCSDRPENDAEQQRRRHVPESCDRGGARCARNRPSLLTAEHHDRRPVVGHERVKDTDGGDRRDQKRTRHLSMDVPAEELGATVASAIKGGDVRVTAVSQLLEPGERELAARTGAPIYYHRSAEVQFSFKPLDDGAEVSLGNVVIRALHTPGHTPESTSFLVTDITRSKEPWFVLTGDTLFVGDIDRPDLGGPSAANDLFTSLHDKLLALPPYVEVYPAHISGSPCGRAMSGKPSSTIGFERVHNAALLETNRDAFVDAMRGFLPAKPCGWAEMIATNRGLTNG